MRTLELSGEEHLHRLGVVPLPPYIREPLADTDRYQTVYADAEDSVAAPTAGLHFTRELLERVRALGAETVFVTLHVGWDSFRPVQTEDPASHKMHTEYWEISPRAADAINRAKREGRRVISVGTTAVRLLEQAAALHCEAALRGKAGPGIDRPSTSEARTEFARYVRGELVEPPGRKTTSCATPSGTGDVLTDGSGWADLFILPGFKFRVVDALVTNFHLPRSTLLMLTSAFAGRELVFRVYHEAIEQKYRFYSFGDCMLVL